MTASSKPHLNKKRVAEFAALARTMDIAPPLNFYSLSLPDGKTILFDDMYPALHAPQVVEFFFFAIIHQYGFWLDDGEKYVAPLYGSLNGKSGIKGSDLLWKLLMRARNNDPDCFSPERLAHISEEDFAAIFSDDNGTIPLFNTAERIALTREYGKWFRSTRMAGQSPTALVEYANDHVNPVLVLRGILTDKETGIPGYCEDPLGKKAELLLMALVNRPEKLLKEGEVQTWRSIIDYHNMRLVLRMGLVTLPESWRQENIDRKLTSAKRERAIRTSTKDAVEGVTVQSGRSMFAIDNLAWSARRYCPETEPPQCGKCPLQSVCAKDIELFQPVIRTPNY